jgi:hypothetical protein
MQKKENNLLGIFKQLTAEDQASVMSFAEYLFDKSANKVKHKKKAEVLVIQKPVDITRPKGEKVVIAIKRLTATYPMINTTGVLDHAAKLMTEHMLHGKDGKLIIDELELLFSQQYDKYCQTFNNEILDTE